MLIGVICFVETILNTFCYLAFWAKRWEWGQWTTACKDPNTCIIMSKSISPLSCSCAATQF